MTDDVLQDAVTLRVRLDDDGTYRRINKKMGRKRVYFSTCPSLH